MPISLEPDKPFAIVLDCDADKPAELRPTFFARSQTMRGHLQICEALEAYANKTAAELFDTTCEMLSKVLCGWQNMGSHVFGQTDLRDLLTIAEARELLRKVAYNAHITLEEKKS